MSLLDNLPHRVTLARTNTSRDEFGGDTPSTSSYASNVECWIQPAAANIVKEFAAKGEAVSMMIYFNENPGLRFNDTITVTLGPYLNRLLVIKGDREDSVGMELLWLAVAEIYRMVPIPAGS